MTVFLLVPLPTVCNLMISLAMFMVLLVTLPIVFFLVTLPTVFLLVTLPAVFLLVILVTAALLAVAAAAESSPGNTACRGETSPLHHAPQFSHSPSAMSRASYCGCKFEHVPAALLPCDPNMYWQLTEEEDRLISQLTEAHRVMV